MKLLLLLIGINANATLLTNLNYSKGYSLQGIPVASDATYSGSKLLLTSVGTSFKKVGISKVKILTAAIYTQAPEKFVRTETGASASITNVGNTGMVLTFLRGLDSSSVREAISKAIQSNIPDIDKPRFKSDIDTLLTVISDVDSFYYGDTITFTGSASHLQYESSKGMVTTIESYNQDLIVVLYRMFLGNPIDNEAKQFKLQLLRLPEDVLGASQ